MAKSIVLLLFVLPMLPAASVWAAIPSIAPLHEVQVETGETVGEKPAWKKLWDSARDLARSNELQQARQAYRNLLAEKPNIVEARWEYGKLLVRLRQWAESAKIVEGLLELEPDNKEYLLAAGEIALRNEHFSKAVKYFGQVYEADPTGALSDEALAGMVAGFDELDNKASAFLLLEQLYLRNGEDEDVLHKLARLGVETGRMGRARHYYSLLTELFPKNRRYLLEAGDAYDDPGFRRRAADYWHRYLKLRPDYLPLHKKLAEYYLAEDRPQAALPHLIEMYNQDYLVAPLALRIAEIYSQKMGRADKALHYYEQFLKTYPENTNVADEISEVRRVLARQYLPIVENNGGEQLWKDLGLITGDRGEIFLLMADQLEEENKEAQAIALLEILHSHRKDERDLSYRLAKLYLQTGRFKDAYEQISLVDKGAYENKRYLLIKAAIEKRLQLDAAALQTFISYLGFENDDMQAALEAVELAGDLGLVEELAAVWRLIGDADRYSADQLQLNLAYAAALRNIGMFGEADRLYDILLKKATETEDSVDIYFHMADTQLARGHVFIAEQIVRQVLARNLAPERALAELTRLSVLDRRTSLARSWLSLLVKRQTGEELDETEDLPAVSHFLFVDILIADEEYDDAQEVLREHPLYSSDSSVNSDFLRKSRRYLARIFYRQKEYEHLLAVLNADDWQGAHDQEYHVLRSLAARGKGKDGVLAPTPAEEVAELSFTALMARAQSYRHYQDPHSALQAVDRALELLPRSARGVLEKIHVLNELSRFDEALALVDKMGDNVVENEYFDRLRLQLEFKSGNFERIVEKVEMETSPPPEKAEAALKEEGENLYFWKKLLLARALWAQNRREEALQVYDSLLAVPVDSMFLEKMEIEKVNFHLPPLKKSFWNALTFSGEEEQDRISTVMEPQFIAKNIGQPIDDIAASLYGKYRWQKLVEKELSARKAVERRDYHRAEKEYLALLEEEKSPESVFDLASIYDKLGLYGKAAELYEHMKASGPLYPGLDEYIEANVLKRQPRISAIFNHKLKKGRDGYYNIKKGSYGIEGWFMPSYDQEVSLSVERNKYTSYDTSGKYYSNTLIGTYSTYFENLIDLNVSFGLDIPVASGSNEFLYKFELIRRLDKKLEVYGRFEQDLVEDTLRSITDSVIFRDLETGLKYDVFPRWFTGADYRYRMYSDDNEQHRYKLWTMYHLFGETSQFKVKYSYEHIRNNDENIGRQEGNFRNEFPPDDRLYWSPEQYWQHLFTIHFKHFFEIENQLDDPLSYCSFDYSYGFEEDNQQSHEFDVNIFLELNRHFLLKGNLNNQNGEDYEETRAGLSLIYRW